MSMESLGARTRVCALRAILFGGIACLSCSVLPVAAQEVAPRLTGAMAIAELSKLQRAIADRAQAMQDDKLQAIVGQLANLRASLQKNLGDDADEPAATLDADERDAVARADAAAKRVQAWLDASAVACTRSDVDAMLAVLSVTLDHLARDTSSQKSPLPVIDGVETLDRRPLFVLRQSREIPRFVLTGENLVDTQCANPKVVATDAHGKSIPLQPQVVAAQPARVELRWPNADQLVPGSYVLRLSAQRKKFLFGCTAEPPAVAVVQVAAPLHFSVTYALIATCEGKPAPVSLDSATLQLTNRDQTVARSIDVSACGKPVSYTITAAVRTADGEPTKMGPITQGPDAGITAGLGNGLTLSWDPALHQVFVRSGKQACKGVY